MMTGRKVGRKSVGSPAVRGNVKTTGKNPFPRGGDLVPPQKTKTARDLLREKQIVEELFDEEWEKNKQRKASLAEFTNLVRKNCVLTDRWMVYDPVFDPSRDTTASLVLEMDKTVEGELRIKRCVKIYEDRSYQVLIDNVDMTPMFDYVSVTKKLETTYDSDKLIHALITKKVCQGLRSYDATNPILGNLSVKQRGKLWYAKDCTVIVTKAFMGNSCNSCVKVRNQIRRCLQSDTRKKARPAMKQVRSTFGKALYSLLNDFSGRGSIPPSQYMRENMVFDEKLGIHVNFELHQRLYIASTMPPPPVPLKARSRKSRRGSARQRYNPLGGGLGGEAYPVQYVTEDGQLCYVTNVMDPVVTNSGEIAYSYPMLVEKYDNSDTNEYITLNDGSNIVIQNVQGQEFTLAEGQEFEIIGEAPSNNTINTSSIEPIELHPADNQQIQIIEVDDATMQQIEVHNGDNMQIASVDPNDPNLSSLFRAFQSQIQGLAL